MSIRSIGTQAEILSGIQALHCPEGFDADLTYGSGCFWKGLSPPRLRFDIDPLSANVTQADSRLLPLEPSSIGSAVFDPPFLTYVRSGRKGNGSMVMARRFAGYWAYSELEDHYQETISEAYRVLRPGGLLVVKCQDIVHNHALQATHVKVIQWAEIEGFKLLDLFVLPATHRMPAPNRKGSQKHARIFHSYFVCLRSTKRTK